MQTLFGRFETWPDLPLARDLAPGVLAALPQPAASTPAPAAALRWALALQALAGALLLAVIWPGAQKWVGGFLR